MVPLTVHADLACQARALDYLLGGTYNFEADRELARRTEALWPTVRVYTRENRAFAHRAVRYLTTEAGIDQFLDVGSGMPTPPALHETARNHAPGSRFVYFDKDPVVVAHASDLLGCDTDGRTAYLEGDLREPEKILARAGEVLDFERPVAVLITAVLHLVPDEWRPEDILDALVGPLVSGSYLVASQITNEYAPQTIRMMADLYGKSAGSRARCRSTQTFKELAFSGRGLSTVDPGVVLVSDWRNPGMPRVAAADVSCCGAVARKG